MLILGGDHLGPNPWRDQQQRTRWNTLWQWSVSMSKRGSQKFVSTRACPARATHRSCRNEVVAQRAARLCEAAERARTGAECAYVIGTEGAYTRGNDVLSGGRIAGDVRGRGGRDAGRASA